LSPTEILEAVNRQLVPENSALLFVTIILGILDPETGDIAYGQGGHNPPLLIRNNGGLSYEPPGGQPLGVFAEAIFGERKIRLEPGDSLLVYTDGVTEAMNSLHQQFGEQRLKGVFESKGNLSACEMTAAVIDSVHEFVGKAEQSDDISLMVIKRRV
jgi:sigma-B regulation protein RsbU (phosphoserine phosphatase)